MAILATYTYKGKSGAEYKFNVYPIDEECPNESGIYIFSKREKNSKGAMVHTPIYIGRAASFEKRFMGHHKEDCISKNGANCVCLMQIPSESERERIEKDLLDNYATRCNEVNNPITPKK